MAEVVEERYAPNAAEKCAAKPASSVGSFLPCGCRGTASCPENGGWPDAAVGVRLPADSRNAANSPRAEAGELPAAGLAAGATAASDWTDKLSTHSSRATATPHQGMHVELQNESAFAAESFPDKSL